MGVTSMLHVPRHGEQLRRGHDVGGGGVDDYLIRGLEGEWLALAQGERIEGAVRGVFCGALEGEGSGAARQFLLLTEVQVEAHHGGVGHHGGGHGT